jgi:hypothetical protein
MKRTFTRLCQNAVSQASSPTAASSSSRSLFLHRVGPLAELKHTPFSQLRPGPHLSGCTSTFICSASASPLCTVIVLRMVPMERSAASCPAINACHGPAGKGACHSCGSSSASCNPCARAQKATHGTESVLLTTRTISNDGRPSSRNHRTAAFKQAAGFGRSRTPKGS